jgi:uncharacterized protein (DUF1330 family)
MSAYVVVNVKVLDPVLYDEYKALAPPSITLYGGRYLARGGRTTVLEGSYAPERFVILEFPSVERARAWWDSAEYARAKAMRQAAARTDVILLEGLPS